MRYKPTTFHRVCHWLVHVRCKSETPTRYCMRPVAGYSRRFHGYYCFNHLKRKARQCTN